jgi:hypothetical protein
MTVNRHEDNPYIHASAATKSDIRQPPSYDRYAPRSRSRLPTREIPPIWRWLWSSPRAAPNWTIGVLVRSQPQSHGWRVTISASSASVVCGWSA